MKILWFNVQKVILLSIIVITNSCDKPTDSTSDSFNRKEMLENYANNLILPALAELQTKVNDLQTAISNFNTNTTIQNLELLQTAWVNAYSAFQYANAYNIGPAAEQDLNKSLVEEIATFPVSETKIENRIADNNTNFNDFNRDARGFLAIEYLIFSLNNDNTTIVNSFSNTNRKTYLTALINNLKTRVDNVKTAWDNGYSAEFINSNGTDVGSSTSKFYNEFVKSFETIKNFKVGVPLGKRPGQTQGEPTRVEAYYSGKSLYFMQLHLNAIIDIWNGKSKTGLVGVGFREYLESIDGGNALIASTLNQWEKVMDAYSKVDANTRMSAQIAAGSTTIDNLHTELQKHTRFFKSDMSSLMGITITYSSGDGD